MKSIRAVSVIGFLATSVLAADQTANPRDTLEAIKLELKPLQERAKLEPEVLAARKRLDEAYRAYWESVRVAMLRLEPEKKKLVEKEIKLRKQLNSVRGEASPTPATKSAKSPS